MRHTNLARARLRKYASIDPISWTLTCARRILKMRAFPGRISLAPTCKTRICAVRT